MSTESKKSMGWTIVLILLGLVALYAGSNWLAILIPAALLVWYGARPMLRSGVEEWPKLTAGARMEGMAFPMPEGNRSTCDGVRP